MAYKKTNKEQRALRKREVLRLRRENCSFREIAEILAVSPSTACNDAKAIVEEVMNEAKDMYEEIKAIELMSLNELQEANMPAALDGDTKASSIILSIYKRRADLLGLDAPVKSKIAHEFDNIKLPKGDPEKE